MPPPKQPLVSIQPEDDGDHVVVRVPRGLIAGAAAVMFAIVAVAWSRITPDLSFFSRMLPSATVTAAGHDRSQSETASGSAALTQRASPAAAPADTGNARVSGTDPNAVAPSSAAADDKSAAFDRLKRDIAEKSDRLAVARRNVSVEMYSTAWCRVCKDARQYFGDSGLAYEEYDVDKDRDADRRLRSINPQHTVPTFSIDGAVLTGFSPAAFESMLTTAAARRAARAQ